jgi:peptide deformylase
MAEKEAINNQVVIVTDPEFLHKPSEPVDTSSADVTNELVRKLIGAFYSRPMAGIAAPQLGIHNRAFVAKLFPGVFVFVNPQLTLKGHRSPSTEGCLSVPDCFRTVERNFNVAIDADIIMRIANRKIERVVGPMELSGFDAFVVQHENDHLDGVLMTDLTEVAPTAHPAVAAKREKKQQKIAARRAERKSKLKVTTDRMSDKNRKAYERAAKQFAKRERISAEIRERYKSTLERLEE